MIDPEKINFMEEWAAKNKCFLQQKGQVGFMRPCVGIQFGSTYVDYTWEDHIWTPDDAYHKHECLAVLVHGEEDDEAAYDKGLEQLFEWVTWLNENTFVVELQDRKTYNEGGFGRDLELMMGGLTQAVLKKAAA